MAGAVYSLAIVQCAGNITKKQNGLNPRIIYHLIYVVVWFSS